MNPFTQRKLERITDLATARLREVIQRIADDVEDTPPSERMEFIQAAFDAVDKSIGESLTPAMVPPKLLAEFKRMGRAIRGMEKPA